MPITKQEFELLFSGTFWSKLHESLIPIPDNTKLDKKNFLCNLYDEIFTKKYYPDLPRGYIVSDKHNKVSRIVPVFGYEDSCVYFFCVKQLEDFIAINRVDGTFGGWTLGNPIKEMEDEEIENLQDVSDDSPMALNSYNPIKWSENWRDFQKRAYEYAKKGNYQFFLKFDVANFYDTVNLHILEDKIRLATEKKQGFVVELLFHFLQNWNRQFERYSRKTVGLPQDEIGDCSRILANFYLQEYDTYMKQQCSETKSTYLRYADDQIIMTNDREVAYDIMFNASKELFKINLNINSSKVDEFTADQFMRYWAFEIFEKLEDIENKEQINQAIEIFFDWLDKNVKFRKDSVLKRIITVVSKNINILNPHLRYRLLATMYEPEFLITLDYWWLNRLAAITNDKEELYKILDGQINKVRFNLFHYTLLKFYKKWRLSYDKNAILKRINDLSIMMS